MVRMGRADARTRTHTHARTHTHTHTQLRAMSPERDTEDGPRLSGILEEVADIEVCTRVK